MKRGFKNFFKSILVGGGGVSPGLSGSVMMIILGLYRNTIDAIATVFKDFKRKFLYLLPVVLGMGVGMLLFSKAIDFFLDSFEMQTRFAFFGLILGTLPLFYRETKKNGYKNRYYFFILGAFLLGFFLFSFNSQLFPTVTTPSFFEKVLIGFAVISSSIVPGIDAAVILSSFGLYDIYISSLSNLDFSVLMPMAIGVIAGAFTVSFIISKLLSHFYAQTFSTLFGLYLAMIPSIFTENCVLDYDLRTLVSVLLMIAGFALSFFLSRIEEKLK
jgi:putative membrane protein